MAVKVAINGFGRIGRNVLRAIVESGRTDIEVVAINDLGPVETNAHLLRYDSVHGRFPHEVTVSGDSIDVGRGPIVVSAERDPANLPWDHIDIVMECTGIFTSPEKAGLHLKNGASRVLVSAPLTNPTQGEKTIVYGVNHNILTADDKIVSNASCTTNCLAPVAKVLNDSVGIARGFMTTVHSYTGDQPSLDTMHKDLYRGEGRGAFHDPDLDGGGEGGGVGACRSSRASSTGWRSGCRRPTSRWWISPSRRGARPRWRRSTRRCARPQVTDRSREFWA